MNDMKNFKIILIVLISISTLIISCEKYLEEDVRHQITADALYPTSQGAEALVNACYSPLRFWYGEEESILFGETATDLFTAGDGTLSNEFSFYGPSLNGSSKIVETFWRYFYTALNFTNTAIARVPVSELGNDIKRTREGEIHFLRALYLWHIVEIWGGVHFTTEESKGVVLTANRTPVETFYNQIFEDLRIAENQLPETQEDYGRATVWAARAMLARMYLYRKDYENAYKYAKMVMDGPFELVESYADLFDIANDEYSSTNKEAIWSVIYATNSEVLNLAIPEAESQDQTNWPQRSGNNLHLFFLSYYKNITVQGKSPLTVTLEYGRSFVRFMPTLYCLDLYDEDIDSRYFSCFQSIYRVNNPDADLSGTSLAMGDTACYMTKDTIPQAVKDNAPYNIYDRYTVYNEDGTPKIRNAFMSMIKFQDPTRANSGDAHSGRDVFVFRLAEMYFIAAEAQMYMGNNDLAADYLNDVRWRAGYPGRKDEMLISPADVNLDFILDEKGREFLGEYIRWFDLKRTGKLVERVRLHNPDAAPNIQEYHTLRPIPQTQLDAITNKDEFTQNPGY